VWFAWWAVGRDPGWDGERMGDNRLCSGRKIGSLLARSCITILGIFSRPLLGWLRYPGCGRWERGVFVFCLDHYVCEHRQTGPWMGCRIDYGFLFVFTTVALLSIRALYVFLRSARRPIQPDDGGTENIVAAIAISDAVSSQCV